MRTLAALLLLLALGSCAPVTEEECRGGDWNKIGFEDGRNGHYTTRFDDIAETCGDFGVAAQKAPYLAGREAGLKLYCTPENLYQEGRRGREFRGVCPPKLNQSLRFAYNHGQNYYEIGEKIAGYEREIDDLEFRIFSLAKTDTNVARREVSEARRDIRQYRRLIFLAEIEQRRYATWP